MEEFIRDEMVCLSMEDNRRKNFFLVTQNPFQTKHGLCNRVYVVAKGKVSSQVSERLILLKGVVSFTPLTYKIVYPLTCLSRGPPITVFLLPRVPLFLRNLKVTGREVVVGCLALT